MAVSLVSTGVQFPDSSIQTTAATAGSMTLISTATSTSGTTVSFTGLTTTYKKYQIVYNGLRNSASASGATYARLGLRFSTNNGSSYISTSNYSYSVSYFDNTPFSPGINVAPTFGDDRIDLYSQANITSGSFTSGTVTLYNPALNPSFPTVKFESTYIWIPQSGYGNPRSGGALAGAGWNYANGAHPFTTTGVNAVQFSWYGGETFTAGTWALYGVNQ